MKRSPEERQQILDEARATVNLLATKIEALYALEEEIAAAAQMEGSHAVLAERTQDDRSASGLGPF